MLTIRELPASPRADQYAKRVLPSAARPPPIRGGPWALRPRLAAGLPFRGHLSSTVYMRLGRAKSTSASERIAMEGQLFPALPVHPSTQKNASEEHSLRPAAPPLQHVIPIAHADSALTNGATDAAHLRALRSW